MKMKDFKRLCRVLNYSTFFGKNTKFIKRNLNPYAQSTPLILPTAIILCHHYLESNVAKPIAMSTVITIHMPIPDPSLTVAAAEPPITNPDPAPVDVGVCVALLEVPVAVLGVLFAAGKLAGVAAGVSVDSSPSTSVAVTLSVSVAVPLAVVAVELSVSVAVPLAAVAVALSISVSASSVAVAVALSISVAVPSAAVAVAPVPPLVTVAFGIVNPELGVGNGPVYKFPSCPSEST